LYKYGKVLILTLLCCALSCTLADGGGTGFGGSSGGPVAPFIDHFVATDGPYNTYVFQGHLSVADPTNFCVHIWGLNNLVNTDVMVWADGTFSYSAVLPPGTAGQVWAQAYDPWGDDSNVATDFIIP
jgi:hypothetical protein